MKTEEFNLSEKIFDSPELHRCYNHITVEDVKEFIRLAREILENCIDSGLDNEMILSNFDKLAGEKLK